MRMSAGVVMVSNLLAVVLLYVTFRVAMVSRRAYRGRPSGVYAPKKRVAKREGRVNTVAVLGSGGHTSEMLVYLSTLQKELYFPLHLVIAATDVTSSHRVPEGLCTGGVHVIPRSREVGQSWASSLLSTLYALIACWWLVQRLKPRLLIINGPGTCVPLALCVLLQNAIGVQPKCSIMFVESVCRVNSLSLSGKIVYWFADTFIVLWPELLGKHPKALYVNGLM